MKKKVQVDFRNDAKKSTAGQSIFIICCAALFCLTSYLMIFFGTQYVDEGYYHLIAKLTAEGKTPYCDYFWVQSPLYPYLYGAFFRIFGPSFLAARGFSALLSLLAFLAAIQAAGRLGGRRAAAACAGLIICQPFTIYFLTIIKLYAATALMLSLTVLALTIRSVTTRYAIASFFLSVAMAIRISVAPGLLLLLILSYFRTRRLKITLIAASIAAATSALCFLPFYFSAPVNFMYGAFTYHSEKEAFGIFRQMLHRLISATSLIELYFVPLLLIAGYVIFFRMTPKDANANATAASPSDIAWILGVIALMHLASQAPYSFRYIPMLLPALAAAIGVFAVKIESALNHGGIQFRWGVVFATACVMTFIARGREDFAGLNQGGVAAYLKRVAVAVESSSPADRPVLTFNNSVAVESRREVMRGDEMNVLTYDPAWPKERCEEMAVLNADMLEESINQKRFGAILTTQYSFIGNFPVFFNPGEEGARPRIMAAIETNYVKIRTFPGFGYLGEDADLYVLSQGRD